VSSVLFENVPPRLRPPEIRLPENLKFRTARLEKRYRGGIMLAASDSNGLSHLEYTTIISRLSVTYM